MSTMTARLTPIRFGEYLLERRVINDGQLLDALAEHWGTGRRIGDVLASRGHVDPSVIERYANEYHGLSVVEVA
jgi:hypothetical protein